MFASKYFICVKKNVRYLTYCFYSICSYDLSSRVPQYSKAIVINELMIITVCNRLKITCKISCYSLRNFRARVNVMEMNLLTHAPR